MLVGGPACVNTEAVTDPALPRPMSEDYQAPSGAGLSPAAQAVLDAVLQVSNLSSTVPVAAAALRAAADLERQSPWPTSIEGCGARWMRDQILAIADELEGAE